MVGKYEKSCGIIPFKLEKGAVKFLLVKNIGGHWEFPKGHQEKGETDKETARREFKEEAGLDVRMILNTPYYEHYYYTWKGKKKSKKVTYFLGHVKSGVPKVQEEEITGYVWRTYRGALNKLTFREVRDILKQAKQELKSYLNK